MRHHFGPRKLPRGILNCALFFGEVKVHWWPSGPSLIRPVRPAATGGPPGNVEGHLIGQARLSHSGRNAMADEKKLAGPDLAKGVPLSSIPDGGSLLGHVGDEAVLLV